ncbi:C4-dicarboxylate ABC transporter permease [Pannonibacter phragmitetus]|uniref:TRAP transporter small permease n=1 Tax=Pannonibacter phragmitetus TaxID=121719 RepID=UPI00067E330A|nr:TRAP transporter small permease [Pannonibacter phragmitetus]KND20606.1 C4-dicarboxylate ABC transporter permease [Pannonibacter phragmitetus]
MSFLLREAEKLICAVIFAGMTLLGFVNVVVRYATSYSLASTEEILTNGFLLLTVFGAVVAARKGDHLAVTLIYERVPQPLRKAMLIFATLMSAVLLALSAKYTFDLVQSQMKSGVRSYALQIPAWYYSFALPIGFAFILLRHLQYSLDCWRTLCAEGKAHA